MWNERVEWAGQEHIRIRSSLALLLRHLTVDSSARMDAMVALLVLEP